jgi:hypothetical protein
VAHHATEAGTMRKINRVEGLGERSDLIDLDQQGASRLLGNAALQPGHVGDE